MKTLRFAAIAFAAFVCVFPVVAQSSGTVAKNDGNWSQYYYINVPIDKVYPYKTGYMVLYRKSGTELARAYLPLKWFLSSGGKGELIKLDAGTEWPYMSVFYKDGAFDHVRLYVRRDMSHPSWGNLPQGTNLDAQFNTEDLKLEF